MNDYYYEWHYHTRATELQDIAAMDRLAAQAAPASALRRYAEHYRGTRRAGSGAELMSRVRNALHIGTARHDATAVSSHR